MPYFRGQTDNPCFFRRLCCGTSCTVQLPLTIYVPPSGHVAVQHPTTLTPTHAATTGFDPNIKAAFLGEGGSCRH